MTKTPGSPELAARQATLAGAIASPGPAWPGDVLRGVIPGGTLDAAGALAVYGNGYLARLTEQLGETYPSVWRVLGDDDFFALCERYIGGHRSTSYNLADYGRDFAAFLEGSAEAADAPFLPELARFELVFHDLFHAAAHVGVDAGTLASIGDLSGVRFRLGSAVRLVACERAVYDLFRQRHEAEPPDLMIARPQWVLLFKRNGDVLAREVDAATFAALESLADGLTVDEAIGRAVEADAGYGPSEVARLFELIARCGLVAAIER